MRLVGLVALACVVASCDARGGVREPNVLLITIDTLRADHLPMYGYKDGRTPALDALAREATVFEHATSHAPITLPSHTTILTGLYPPQHGARSNGSYRAPAELDTLAEKMRAAGYRTGAFVSAFVLDSRYGLDQGFDVYDDDLVDGRKKLSKFGVKDRQADNTLSRALAWIDGESGRFFAWVHLYDPHFPYEAPEPFRSAFANPYDAEIAYVDAALGRFFDGLKKSDRFAETLVVLTSDHGESFGEHGESTHSLFVYEATQHIPLLVRLPGGRDGGQRVKELARHVDILPTVMGVVAGDKQPGLLARGRSEAPSYAEAYLPLEQFGWSPLYAWRDARYKFIDAPKPELYDLASDPHELRNLATDTDLAPYRKRLAALQATLMPVARDATVEVDAAATDALAALGYVNRDDKRPSDRGRDPKDMVGMHEIRELAHARIERGEYLEAIPILQEGLVKDPGNHAIYNDLGAVYGELARWAEAEQAFKAAARLSPANSEAHCGLAKVYFRGLRNFAAAAPEIALALEHDPKNPGLWTLKGDFLHDQGHMAQAAEAYAKAVALGEQNASLYAGYASALSNLGRLEEAKRTALESLRIDDTNVIAHYNLAVVLERLGDTREAEASYRRAIEHDPRRTMLVYEGLGNLLDRQGREGDALSVLNAGLGVQPDAPGLLYLVGSLHLRHGRAEEALPFLEKAVRLRPEAPPDRTNLGYAYEKLGRHAAATTQYTILRTLYPKNTGGYADASLRIARMLVRQGKRDKAESAVREGLATGIPLVAETVRQDPELAALIR